MRQSSMAGHPQQAIYVGCHVLARSLGRGPFRLGSARTDGRTIAGHAVHGGPAYCTCRLYLRRCICHLPIAEKLGIFISSRCQLDRVWIRPIGIQRTNSMGCLKLCERFGFYQGTSFDCAAIARQSSWNVQQTHMLSAMFLDPCTDDGGKSVTGRFFQLAEFVPRHLSLARPADLTKLDSL